MRGQIGGKNGVDAGMYIFETDQRTDEKCASRITFIVLPGSVGIDHVLRVDDAIISKPDKLLRANYNVVVLRRAPTGRKGPTDYALSRSCLHYFFGVAWYIELPAFASASGTSRGEPFG